MTSPDPRSVGLVDEVLSPFSDPQTLQEGFSLAVSTTSDGSTHAYFVPARAQRLAPEAAASFADVQQAALAVVQAQDILASAVAAARETGVSWSLIAWAAGLSEDGARKRWMPDEP